MHQRDRVRVAVLLATAAMVALGIGFVWLHIASPSDGARIVPTQRPWHTNGVAVAVLRPQPDGLRSGDVVVAVDGKSVESWAQALADPTTSRPQRHFGQVSTYTVVRGGVTLDVPVTLGAYPMAAIWQEGWSTIVFALVFELVALYVVVRRPGDRAPLVLLVAASGILGATTWSFGLQVGDLIGGVGFWLYKATTSVDFLLFYIATLHFALIFPKRYPLLQRHPWWLWTLYLTPFVLDALYLSATRLTSPNVPEWIGRANAGEDIIVLVLMLLIIVTISWTYRTNRDAETRAKIRWLVFGALISGISGLVLWQLPPVVLGHPLISANALGLLVLPLPLSIAIAILRHRLFDIDTILNRTLVYGSLSGIVAGVYIVIVAALGTIFQARGNLLIALVAAGAVAVLFQPLRLWLQRSIDRLMFGERDNPYAVLSRLGRRLETALAPEAVLPTVVETVAHALKLPSVAIAIKEGDRLASSVEYGVPVGAQVTLPLVYHSEMVGELRVSPRAPSEPFTEAEKHLLVNIAHQAGIAVHATRLTADLQHSRARLVTAREEERRRLRRDLHDGIGPTLAGMTLRVGAIRNLLTSDPAAADRMLGELGGEIESAVGDIRRLVYALRPPALDELGLVGALRAQAAHYAAKGIGEAETRGEPKLLVTIDAPLDLPPLPAAVEVAAYRIACEALTNAARHAGARTCHIVLSVDSALRVEVCDDGLGLAPERRVGVGLVSMRERAEELGGTCSITSAPGEGVRIHTVLPLTKE
jgi:two-component system NarL family sensor kinase